MAKLWLRAITAVSCLKDIRRTSWYREAGDALHEWRSIYYTKASVFI
jgi:hypothetical protein